MSINESRAASSDPESIPNEMIFRESPGTMQAPARFLLMLWWRVFAGCACAGLAWVAPHGWAGSTPSDPGAARRGRLALLQHSYLKAEWKIDAYRNAGKLWGTSAPDPEKDPEGYARAFALHYGLRRRQATPNEGLPMGLRWSQQPDGTKTGIQLDCIRPTTALDRRQELRGASEYPGGL